MKDDMPSVGRHVLRYLRDKVKRCPQLPARCFKDEKMCVYRQTHAHMHTHTTWRERARLSEREHKCKVLTIVKSK